MQTLRTLAAKAIDAIPAPVVAPLVRAVGWFGRHRMLSAENAAAIVDRMTRGRRRQPCVIRRELFGQRVRLHIDLAFAGCRELLVSPTPGDPDRGSALLFRALASEADLVLDVGANVGLYTCLAASIAPAARVIAFEPIPTLAALIRATAIANDWDSRVTVRSEAIGARTGTLTMYVLPDADTEATLEASRVAGRPHASMTVPVVSLADVLRSAGTSLDRTVMKIDVEGHERAALEGLEPLLTRTQPRPDILIEFLGEAIHSHVIEQVLGYGLHVHYIGPSGLTLLHRSTDLATVHTLGYWNFFLTTRSPADVQTLWTRATRLHSFGRDPSRQSAAAGLS